MESKLDFEQTQIRKFATALDEFADEEVREGVMDGSEELSSDSACEDVICWSRQAMDRLTDRLLLRRWLLQGDVGGDSATTCGGRAARKRAQG